MSECRLHRADGSKNSFPLAQGPVTFGRGASANLRIDDEFVSRLHCEVFLRNGSAVIRDLNSHNGTFVNGNRTEESVLATGDKLQLGKTNLIVQLDARVVPAQAGEASPQHAVDAIFRVIPEEPQRPSPAQTVLIPGPRVIPPKP